MDKKNIIILAICIIIPMFAGFIGSFAMSDSLITWYPTLHKSPLNPPNWVFAPVWTILYILMGISVFLVIIRRQESQFFVMAISLFILQLFLNAIWTWIFFKMQSPMYAYIEILLLDAVVLLTVYAFGKVSRLAQLLMLPYVIWLGFASYLNWYVASF